MPPTSDTTATDLTNPGPASKLYVYVQRPAGLDFHGAEIDLVWHPAGGDIDNCFTHIGTLYPTSGGTSCTYLNRAKCCDHALPIVP